MTFKVKVWEMVESHRLTYWVVLLNSDRAADAKVWDSVGKITPCCREQVEESNEEAECWAKFLGCDVELYPTEKAKEHQAMFERGEKWY